MLLPVRLLREELNYVRAVKWRHGIICGRNPISMVCGNTAYCVKLSGEDDCRVIRTKLNQLV